MQNQNRKIANCFFLEKHISRIHTNSAQDVCACLNRGSANDSFHLLALASPNATWLYQSEAARTALGEMALITGNIYTLIRGHNNLIACNDEGPQLIQKRKSGYSS